MKLALFAGLAALALPGCAGVAAHGPPETAYRVAYFTSAPGPVHAAVRRILEGWKVPIRSDDGRVVKSRAFRDGPSVWKMRVEIEHSGGTTAVLVKMEILEGGDVEPEIVDADFESIIRWQIGGDPDAYISPENPTHSDQVRSELVGWLKRWREGNASTSSESETERARNRRELFLNFLRMTLPP